MGNLDHGRGGQRGWGGGATLLLLHQRQGTGVPGAEGGHGLGPLEEAAGRDRHDCLPGATHLRSEVRDAAGPGGDVPRAPGLRGGYVLHLEFRVGEGRRAPRFFGARSGATATAVSSEGEGEGEGGG